MVMLDIGGWGIEWVLCQSDGFINWYVMDNKYPVYSAWPKSRNNKRSRHRPFNKKKKMNSSKLNPGCSKYFQTKEKADEYLQELKEDCYNFNLMECSYQMSHALEYPLHNKNKNKDHS